mgnify:CR=1 FL=1
MQLRTAVAMSRSEPAMVPLALFVALSAAERRLVGDGARGHDLGHVAHPEIVLRARRDAMALPQQLHDRQHELRQPLLHRLRVGVHAPAQRSREPRVVAREEVEVGRRVKDLVPHGWAKL